MRVGLIRAFVGFFELCCRKILCEEELKKGMKNDVLAPSEI